MNKNLYLFLAKHQGLRRELSVKNEEREEALRRFEKEQETEVPYAWLEKQVLVRETVIQGCRCVILSGKTGAADRAVLYLYGGAFLTGAKALDFQLGAYLAKNTGQDVWILLYPLFPKHLIHESAEAVLEAMKRMAGHYDRHHITWFGFSSGASLCMYAWMMNRRESRCVPMPERMILNSPVLRVPVSEEEKRRMEAVQDDLLPPVFFSEEGLCGMMVSRDMAYSYLGDVLSFPLRYFPETDLFFGTNECLRIFLEEFEEKCAKEHISLHVQEGKGLWHCYGLDPRTPEGKAAWMEYISLLKRAGSV